MTFEEFKKESIFPIGDKNEQYASVFTKQSYIKMLAQSPDGQIGIGNVTFEPGCRNYWHKHTTGYQILLVTNGQGIYQEEGKEPCLLEKGDVIITNQNVKHWHGATATTWFSHVAITSGESEFLEPVSKEDYYKANVTLESRKPK